MSTQSLYDFDSTNGANKAVSLVMIPHDRTPLCFIFASGELGIQGTSASEPSQFWEDDRCATRMGATASAPAGSLIATTEVSVDDAVETTGQAILTD